MDAKQKDVTNFNFTDDSFVDHLSNSKHENHKQIKQMLLHLALCHTVVVDYKEGKQFYNASSPDELALVNAAKYFSYSFQGRDDDNNIELEVDGNQERVELLNVIEFTSLRKRMTVFLKTPEGNVKVMCKGADSIILARLSTQSAHN
jgi:phospholipid-transporting ATPase